MIKIVFIGDSHTWGQGASGFDSGMEPPPQAGEHRQISFASPCYVNLFRNYINEHHGSSCRQIDLPAVTNGRAIVPIQGSMFRVQAQCGRQGASAGIFVDGRVIGRIDTYGDDGPNNYKIWVFSGLSDEDHEVEIRGEGPGDLIIYRVECYSGKYAVINSGVGSCATGQYLDTYWQDYVETYQPGLVVIEGFSINDWIRNTPLDQYKENLSTMFKKVKECNGTSILLTVSPILGSQQFTPDGPQYSEYIQVSIRAAQSEGVPVADAFQTMMDTIKPWDPAVAGDQLFADAWHVNDAGHRIYFDCVLKQALSRFLR
jgi:lysophospholipase L1-like esterase